VARRARPPARADGDLPAAASAYVEAARRATIQRMDHVGIVVDDLAIRGPEVIIVELAEQIG
jgi:hypothetical protein